MNVAIKDAEDRIRDLITRTHIFCDWPKDMIEMLAEGAQLRRFADGERAVRSGEPSPQLALVAKGSFICQRSQKDGSAIIFDYLMPGQATSHLAVFDGYPPVFDIVSHGESEMIFIPRKSLMAAIARDPNRLMDFILMLCRRMRLEYENVYMRTASSVRGQIARIILYWLRGQDPNSGKLRVPVGVSQENMAAMLGKSRPTINKEIGAMIKEGILARRYRQLEVLDVKALAGIVERESPGFLAINIPIFTKPKGVLNAAD
ncbi:MAG TPA: Crp/Fnr family transcriptional regulator [Rhizomicrobium sp.]|nr:Crp/Fnr family transcriptional regulator [Rhizomicrobium sp.]